MLNFAIESARDAGHILLEKFGKIEKITKKGDINLVTEADLASEKLINARMLPNHEPGQRISRIREPSNPRIRFKA